tara:strand:+ start:600 stop:1067 length:468 start_codon:yes stop_codon:yes gene_type:complete
MSEYNPNNWVVLKVKEKENTAPFYKVLAGWGGANWRINSGVTTVKEEGDYYEFYGKSGSCYRCHKKDYGLRMNTQGVYKKLWIQQEFDDQITLMPEDTNWMEMDGLLDMSDNIIQFPQKTEVEKQADKLERQLKELEAQRDLIEQQRKQIKERLT